MREVITFPIVFTNEQHKKVKEQAKEEHLSMNKFIIKKLLEGKK